MAKEKKMKEKQREAAQREKGTKERRWRIQRGMNGNKGVEKGDNECDEVE
jgi:hypothetical protein